MDLRLIKAEVCGNLQNQQLLQGKVLLRDCPTVPTISSVKKIISILQSIYQDYNLPRHVSAL